MRLLAPRGFLAAVLLAAVGIAVLWWYAAFSEDAVRIGLQATPTATLSATTSRAGEPATPAVAPATPATAPPLVPSPQPTSGRTVASGEAPAAPSAPSERAAGEVVTIDMAEPFFNPSQVRIAVGTTVIWKNVGVEAHDAVAQGGLFNSGALQPGQSYSFTFTSPGRFPYICTLHVGEGMMGEVVVE